MKTIKLRVDRKGNVQLVDITGAGAGCSEIAEKLKAFAGDPDETTRQNTTAFYEQTEQQASNDVEVG